MKFKSLVLVAALMGFGAGCAFKQPTQIDDARVRVLLDWSTGSSVSPSREVKASRSLTKTDAQSFSAEEAATLPVLAPDWVQVGISVPEEEVEALPSFGKARIEYEGKQSELPLELGQVRVSDGLFEAGVTVGGMQALLSMNYSARALLTVELYTRESRVLTVSLPLRTPPSQLEVLAGGVSSARDAAKPTETGLITPVISGVQFNLVRSIEFTNREDAPVEIRIPREIRGVFQQKATSLRLEDTGCGQKPGDRPGYSHSKWPVFEAQTANLFLIPMDDLWVIEAKAFASKTAGAAPILRTLAPGASLTIGLYAVGGGSDGWAERMALGDVLSEVTGPGKCKWQCVESISPCGPGGACLMSRCSAWLLRGRTKVKLPVGLERREAPTVEFLDGGPVLSLRFADFDPNQDGEVRPFRAFPESMQVEL